MSKTNQQPFRLSEKWDSYLEEVVPDDAGPGQILETRRAFYAGAISVFYGLPRDLDNASKATRNEQMKSVRQELDAFVESLDALEDAPEEVERVVSPHMALRRGKAPYGEYMRRAWQSFRDLLPIPNEGVEDLALDSFYFGAWFFARLSCLRRTPTQQDFDNINSAQQEIERYVEESAYADKLEVFTAEAKGPVQ